MTADPSQLKDSTTPPVLSSGAPIQNAPAAIILVHGRGASAQSMLELFAELDLPQYAALAPQARAHSWYPHSFLAPLPSNQPFLDAALAQLEKVVSDVEACGIPGDRICLLGFSQGACLATEFAARNPRKYGALIAFTGGLIGPPGTPRNYRGSLQGTPVFLGSSDPDPHVPFERVQETERVFRHMGATVDIRRYPGMAHTINADELDAARALILRATASSQIRPRVPDLLSILPLVEVQIP